MNSYVVIHWWLQLKKTEHKNVAENTTLYLTLVQLDKIKPKWMLENTIKRNKWWSIFWFFIDTHCINILESVSIIYVHI